MLIAIGFIIFAVGILFAIKIEQVAGYYECQKCNKKSWQKKVLGD